MLYEYLQKKYSVSEPIFYDDIEINLSRDNIRHQMLALVEAGKIAQFSRGIYFIPEKSLLNCTPYLPIEKVMTSKYIARGDKIMGYYTGYTFANQIGLSTQVPVTQEISTNEIAANIKYVKVGKRAFRIRKSRVEVDSENVKLLQLLDLLKDLGKYSEFDDDTTKKILCRYIKANKIRRNDIDKYIELFPLKIYKEIYKLRLYDVFA